jgi:hypothetical protein
LLPNLKNHILVLHIQLIILFVILSKTIWAYNYCHIFI